MDAANSYVKTQSPLPKTGTQLGTCYAIIDLGTHMKSFQGQPAKPSREVRFCWELPDFMHVYDATKNPNAEPMSVSQSYGLSNNDKSKLPKMLKQWKNIQVIERLNSDFLKTYLGTNCLMTLVHKGDKSTPVIYYANIDSSGTAVMPLMAGMPTRPVINPVVFFDLDAFSWETFNAVPKWIQKTITESQEWSGIVAKFGANPLNTQAAAPTQQSAPAPQQQAPAQSAPQTAYQPPVATAPAPSAPAPTMAAPTLPPYNVFIDGKDAGTFTHPELLTLISQGKLTHDSHVWKAGLAEWVKAGTIQELAAILPPF